MIFRTARASVAATIAIVLVLSLLVLPQTTTRAQSLPSGLPNHFGFGLAAGQGDTWLPQSGIPWDYRYQYLAGGVNTGNGWENWNANATFALNYATESAQHGYIPVYPYYELLQSSGSCGSCGEGQKDITNLNTPSLMAAYYQNFALLMKRLGPGTFDGISGFGKTAIIDVEPDFTGGYSMQAVNNNASACFGFCSGQANDPTLLKASVASSGAADVAGLPDTYAGFTRALAHLRDLYAPNVLLAYHVSNWATGIDIGSDTRTTIDPAAQGSQVGTFMSQFGAHELLFNDPLDRDAGQYKVQFGQNRWWDRQNVTFPNFTRWEQYLHAAIVADASRPMLLWQIPVGNQYFLSEDNTNGHFQDNRAEYIFGHVPELIQTGIIGALFGAGNGGSTQFTDAMKDGVTNPPQVCTTDGTSSGQICNSHTSSVADDDGGFLRMSGQAYYQAPVALGGGAATSTPVATATATPGPATFSTRATVSPGSVARGASESISASVTSSQASTVLVDVEVYDASGAKQFQQVLDNQTFTAGQTRTYAMSWQVPSTATTGTDSVDIGIFSPGWGTLYSWNGPAASFSVVASAPTATATSTPTRTPTPTLTSTPVPARPSFSSSARVSPASVARGSAETITAAINSLTPASALVDLEVYDASGHKVFQQAWDNQTFAGGQSRSYTATWSVPSSVSSGTCTVKIGVFAPGWATLYSWNDRAASISVT